MLRPVLPPALTRLVEEYLRVLKPATAGAALASVALAVVAGAHLARVGTFQMRLFAAAMILASLGAVLARWWVQRKWGSSEERAVQSVLVSTQPEVGSRIARALRLAGRPPERSSGESPELAKLHYERLLSRASKLAVTNTARERARRFGRYAVVATSVAVGTIVLSPQRVVEGLNVLGAKGGVAPFEMTWLEPPEVEAHPPSYLRQPTDYLVFESASVMPEGTELVLRARPLVDGRQLVVTDGKREQPFVEDGSGAVVARWELEDSADLKVAAKFGDVLIYEPRAIDVYSQPDGAPRVELAGAPSEIPLDKMQRLELRWSAEDDHSIVEVELVMRSAGKEARRNLERYPGDKREASGGYVLYPDDEFLQRIFLPAVVRIEARDNDPREGSKWGRSEAITIRPPNVGAPQAQRYLALLELRHQLVDLLAFTHRDAATDATGRSEHQKALTKRLDALSERAGEVLYGTYSGLSVPRGWANFAMGQLQKLEALRRRSKDATKLVEGVLLGLDNALNSLSTREAQTVSKQLAHVADEAAVAARIAQGEKNRAFGIERLDLAVSVLDLGAKQLSELGLLGQDLGSVALADLNRLTRSRQNNDFMHAELVALHMAARLRRPNPSFGSQGGGGGVESGPGMGGGAGADAQGETSQAESDFDRMAQELERLSQEHAEAVGQTEGALREAERQTGSEGLAEEARQRAEALRRATLRLPQPGEPPGTGRASAALLKEHGSAMAHELERLAFEEALESARRALGASEEALRKGDLNPFLEREAQKARDEIREQMAWAEEQLQRKNQRTEESAREALEKVSDLERELSERARRLSAEEDAQHTLPRETLERLEQAQRLMQDAAQKLGGEQGLDGLDLQRRAQRLLEEAKPGRTSDEEGRAGPRSSDSERSGGKRPATGGDVPNPDERNEAEEFRRRVLEGLKKGERGRLSPAIQRYAEGLLR